MNPIAKRSLITLGVAILAGTASLVLLHQYLSNKERLVADFRTSIVGRDFQEMYADSSAFMKLNVTETEFIQRMTVVANILEKADPEIRFSRNVEEEDRIRSVRNASDPEESGYSFALLDLGEPETKLRVHVSWIQDRFKPRLFDLSIGEAPSIGNRIQTVAGEPFQAY